MTPRQTLHICFTIPLTIAGLSLGIAQVIPWWGALLCGVAMVILVWLAGILGEVLADRGIRQNETNRENQDVTDD